jgi:hypothetical protein
MQRVVAFYEKLPRGPAPAAQPKGLLQRYQHRYMNGKNARAARTYREYESQMWKEDIRILTVAQLSPTSLAVFSSSVTHRTTTSTCVSNTGFTCCLVIANSRLGHHKNNAH